MQEDRVVNESSLPRVSKPLNSGVPRAEPLSAESLSADLLSADLLRAGALRTESSRPEPKFDASSDLLSADSLRDLPSSTYDIPMAVRETPSPVPQTKSQSARLFLGLGSLGAIALLGLGLLFALRPPSATAPSAIPASATSGSIATANVAVKSASSAAVPSPGSVDPNASAASLPSPLLNHLPYDEAPKGELTPITPNGEILMRKAAAAKFMEMQESARAAGVSLVPISGFRSIDDQNHVFFDVKAQRGQNTTTRSEVSAPPGYSEHHTGYAVDIGDGDHPDLNLQTEFEAGQAYQWLKENAGFYSFELSFPKNNTQGVSYEPWHWRFVGDRSSLETFYRARSSASPSSVPPSSVPPKVK